MLADIILIVFVVLFIMKGRKTGFARSVLGMFSVIICGALTVFIYKYIDKTGAVELIGNLLKTFLPQNAYDKLEAFGVSGYVLNAIIAILLYVGIRILYKIGIGVIDFAMPSFINSLLGGLFGGAMALAVVLAVLAVIYSVRNTCDVTAATDFIEKSQNHAKMAVAADKNDINVFN